MAQVLYKNFEIQLILALTVFTTACTNTDLMHTTAIDTVFEETQKYRKWDELTRACPHFKNGDKNEINRSQTRKIAQIISRY